jgi:hypothetical protein
MKRISRLAFVLHLLVLCCTYSSYANNPTYLQRRDAYIDSCLAHFSTDAFTLQAFRGIPVDTGAINTKIRNIAASETSDFDIVQLVRVLCLSSGQYDTMILPVLRQQPFWLTKNEVHRNYWSENHMIMWMSSNWLLHERYGFVMDSGLDTRLRHYLQLKVQYGFYEFFSSVYSPYCLSGLINLADFSQDAQIKQLAIQASQRMLKDLLLLTNDKGVFYPTAGRNYYGKYLSPYGQNHNNLIYLLTGMGDMPRQASHAGGFLASSSLEVDSVIGSWVANLDTQRYNGHTLDSGRVINQNITGIDKTIFQWSSGGYFHPLVVQETATLLTDSGIWRHPDFAPFRSFSSLPVPAVVQIANSLTCLSESSVISGEMQRLFKHKSITLSSVQDFWPGKGGFQEFPCVANVGTTPVLTVTGTPTKDWGNKPESTANTHLPYVNQHRNVALLMYWPEVTPSGFGFDVKDVGLLFKTQDYDEVRNDSLWLLGRQGNNYVAVRRHCFGMIDSVYACPTNPGQSWVIMVGDSDMYGSFNQFQNIIDQSQFTETWRYDSAAHKEVFYAKISVDTVTIEHTWTRDSTVSTGIASISESSLRVYPNPATDKVAIDLTEYAGQPVHLAIYNMMGQPVYDEQLTTPSNGTLSISMSQWQSGVYQVQLETGKAKATSRLVKME